MLVSVRQKFDQEHYVYIHVCSALLCRLAAPCVISDCPIAGCVLFFSSASIEWLRLERILQCPQGLLPCPILCNSTETNPGPTQLNYPPFLSSQGPFAVQVLLPPQAILIRPAWCRRERLRPTSHQPPQLAKPRSIKQLTWDKLLTYRSQACATLP